MTGAVRCLWPCLIALAGLLHDETVPLVLLSAGALGSAALVAWDVRRGKSRLSEASVASEVVTAPVVADANTAKPQVIDATPKYLVGLFRGHTSIQGRKLAQAYLGKWIEVSGRLGDVGEFNAAGAQVVFQGHLGLDLLVFMWFQNKEYVDERLVGSPATFAGFHNQG